jgi:hypothetical protein
MHYVDKAILNLCIFYWQALLSYYIPLVLMQYMRTNLNCSKKMEHIYTITFFVRRAYVIFMYNINKTNEDCRS